MTLAEGASEVADSQLQNIKSELAEKEQSFVTALAERDRTYAAEIAVFRGAVEDIASTPEGVAALALYNDGDEIGAIAILDDLRTARDAARQVRVNMQSAVEARRIATLALDARRKGKLTTNQLIVRFEEIVELDPAVHWDWVCHLYTSPSPRDLSTSRMPSSA